MRQSWKMSRSILLVGLTATLFLACGSSTTQPSGDSAAGNYTASSFVTSGNSGQRNELAYGSTLVLNLTAAGTTSGHLHIAANGAIQAFDADMAGTWTQSGTTVSISQSVDTFVRNTPFQLFYDPAGGWELVGDQIFSGTLFQIVLKRA
jgi:hypothetical protein